MARQNRYEITLTALQTAALKTVHQNGHTHGIAWREVKALKAKDVIGFADGKEIVTPAGIQCLIEAGVINEQPAAVVEVEAAPATPELSETETIALMLIAETPMEGFEIRNMMLWGYEALVDVCLYDAGMLITPNGSSAHNTAYYEISDTGRAYLTSKGL